jgi:hypothetical protein
MTRIEEIKEQLERNIDPATLRDTPPEILELCSRYAINGNAKAAYDLIEEWVAFNNDLDQVRQHINRAVREVFALTPLVPA